MTGRDVARPGALGGALSDVREQAPLLVLLCLFAFVPVFLLWVHVAHDGGMLTGVNGGDYFDQFQYLAWIRDEGMHGLASNLWVTGSTPHDYLQPMYLVSGVLWRLGLSLQLSYLLWKPIAVAVMFLGFAAYVRHAVAGGRWARTAALALALFYVTPLSPLAHWTSFISAAHGYQLTLAVDDANASLDLWGLEHTAIAIGLMPVFLIACEALLREDARVGRGRIATAAGAGALVSWLHPWQGAILLAIVGGLFVARGPRRRYLRLAVPVAATLAPLLYGLVLSRTDASWQAFERLSTSTGTGPWWALAMSFGAPVLVIALGARRPAGDREWIVVLWLAATAVVYLVIPQFPPHALCGVTLPLAVLAVNSWPRAVSRVRLTGIPAAALGAAAVLTFTVPGIVRHAQDLPGNFQNTIGGGIARSMYRLTADQAAAMRFLARDPHPGGVLAPWLLSMSVPAYTGRAVYAGHLQWEPQADLPQDVVFFGSGRDGPSATRRRAILAASRARFVLDPCGPPGLAAALAPVAGRVAQFGCVTVYETR